MDGYILIYKYVNIPPILPDFFSVTAFLSEVVDLMTAGFEKAIGSQDGSLMGCLEQPWQPWFFFETRGFLTEKKIPIHIWDDDIFPQKTAWGWVFETKK